MTETFFNYKNNHYFFNLNGSGEILKLQEDRVLVLIYLYISLGENKSQKDLSDIFNLSKSTIKELIKSLGITKNSPLVLPHDLSYLRKEEITFASQENLVKVKPMVQSMNRSEGTEKIEKSLGKLETPEIQIQPKEYDKSILIFNFSDWHIGRLVHSPGLEPFNYKILKERIGCILSDAKLYAKLYSPEKLVVNFLGDLIDGPLANMHKSQGLHQEFGSYEQIDKCRSLVVFVLNTLFETYNCPIEVYAVPGNHDRVTTDKSEDVEFIAHSSIFNSIKHSLSNSSIRINEVSGIYRWNAFPVNENIRCIMFHGDNSLNVQKLLNADMRYGAEYKIVIRGHEHRRMFTEAGRNYAEIVNPSLIGNTEFGYYENAYITRPGQSLVIVSPKNNTFTVQCIWLDC